MSETALQSEVLKILKRLGYRTHHIRQGRAAWHLGSGIPDLAFGRAGRFGYAELKKQLEELEPKQVEWRDILLSAGIEWHLWRPSDLRSGRIEEELR